MKDRTIVAIDCVINKTAEELNKGYKTMKLTDLLLIMNNLREIREKDLKQN